MKRWWLMPLLLFGVLSDSASALTVSVPLKDLVGEVGFMPATGGQVVAFDAHQQFSAIESVSIEIEAHVKAREFDVCGTAFDPQPCVHEIQLLGFFARLDKEGSPILGTISSEGLTFSEDFRALEGYGIDSALFRNTRIGWDFLLDGRGAVTVFWNSALGNPDRIILNYKDPSGVIISARLIIEGTPIPEPSTGLLLAVGFAGLGWRRREPERSRRSSLGA